MKKLLAIIELYLIILLMPSAFCQTAPSSDDEVPSASEIKKGLDDGTLTIDMVAQWANTVPPKLEMDSLWFRLDDAQRQQFLVNKNTDLSKFQAKFQQQYKRNVNFNSIKASTDGSKVTLEGGASLDFSQLSPQDVVNAINIPGVGLCWEVNGDKLCGNVRRQPTVPGTTDTPARDTYSISDGAGNTFNVDLSLVDPQDRDAVYVDPSGLLHVPKGAIIYAQTTGNPFSAIEGPQYSIIPPNNNRVREIFTTGRTNVAGNTFQFTHSWQADTVRAGTPQGTAFFNCQVDVCSSSLTFAGNDVDIRYTNIYDPENREFKTTFNYIGTFTPAVPIKNWQVASKKDGDIDIKLADSDSDLEQAMANNPNLDAAISFDLSHARDAGADKQQRDAIMLWKPGWVPNLGPDAKLTANLNGNQVAQAVSRIQNTGINLRPTVPPEDIGSTRQRIEGYLDQGNYRDALRLANRLPAAIRRNQLRDINDRMSIDPYLNGEMQEYYGGLIQTAEQEINRENQVALLPIVFYGGLVLLGVAVGGVMYYYQEEIGQAGSAAKEGITDLYERATAKPPSVKKLSAALYRDLKQVPPDPKSVPVKAGDFTMERSQYQATKIAGVDTADFFVELKEGNQPLSVYYRKVSDEDSTVLERQALSTPDFYTASPKVINRIPEIIQNAINNLAQEHRNDPERRATAITDALADNDVVALWRHAETYSDGRPKLDPETNQPIYRLNPRPPS